MFKIKKMVMYGIDDEKVFNYKFKSGVNYFKGKNSSGKTEFYKFIDFMFGSSEDIRKKPWYSESLTKATMIFEFDDISYNISRTRDPSQNYLYYSDEEEADCIDLKEYKEKLNLIFTRDIENLKDIRLFTEEDLTYRTFTLFNFLGEKRQGAIHDFFDKCSDLKYSIKLTPVLNLIFNNNLEKIYELQKELNTLLREVKKLEVDSAKYEFIYTQVNINLQKLGVSTMFTGKNADVIKKYLNEIKEMHMTVKNNKSRNISELEVMYNNITEQIKVYENRIEDVKQMEKNNINRKVLLNNLNEILEQNDDFEYLVTPLRKLIFELDNTISFSKFLISDNTIKELRKQRALLKTEIKKNDFRFKAFSLDEKARSIALIEDYLSTDVRSCEEELKEKNKRIKNVRDELRLLQNSDDNLKISALSDYITELYKSAKEVSSVVNDDFQREGFKISYLKKGNILQPTITKTLTVNENLEEKKSENYYIGSMARHTLIQLCGYLGFLKLLLKEGRYPLIPILVIDHISKPFDRNNCRAIGKIINKALNDIGKEEIQLFMFDDEEYNTLEIVPDHSENLVTNIKTGFNPFYTPLTGGEEL
ncbi:hypothetical protein [Paenibacillus sp. OK076]|uniref:hypothetical protein n=1 Tax=Paenibacillus sp. OK076 TaxID=1884379 RepID=UPI0008AAF130|nr:hypothetical protein [Paenibacillus sp. OK076]SEO05655.1 hypothetical protein SAMN05518670_3492 [Paenibacillus sp. OK076]